MCGGDKKRAQTQAQTLRNSSCRTQGIRNTEGKRAQAQTDSVCLPGGTGLGCGTAKGRLKKRNVTSSTGFQRENGI